MGAQTDADPGAAGRRSRALPWPVLCWVTVLVLIGAVQIVRAQWFDAIVFFGAALLVVAARWAPPTRTRRAPLRMIVAGAALAGLVVGLLPRHGSGMVAAVTAIGIAAVALAWPGAPAGPPPWTRDLRRLAWLWSGLVVAGCLWELVQFILSRIHPDAPSSALSDLMDPLLDGAPGRILFAAVWLAGGVFLLRAGARR
ncbi:MULTISPECIES: hypothetical protein [unclassified Microbacterium]|uniref:hypothetical protein n=1 Tax=unclassified Microbacterium TaxID=2609290 RepID=UPI00365B7578